MPQGPQDDQVRGRSSSPACSRETVARAGVGCELIYDDIHHGLGHLVHSPRSPSGRLAEPHEDTSSGMTDDGGRASGG